ncbi:Sugar kinase of the NBD/HSP70 family, may contain an N-terminal HTH domain [Reichenbachiella faecimaris]|uniref:Sugar kinase of the NBD/HSP70 family, may contain an N-terminal HTH domain n=1 Tax=Reichenbachiella faecimaris TaxID=692418 RepID=A0A1W2GDX5_REIFA|nr:ROK family protein [Reichenbachiella faecimaris]SMD34724.1 Sugar kinase of the NBD/HSP70 family, may contain an N-terminal HTH domain [Reichenbachiella faecimaris]
MKWGIDLGGTKIEGIILDSSNEYSVVARQRIPTEGDKGYHHVLFQVKRLVEALTKESGLKPAKIGIGTPGSIYPPTGHLKNSNSQHLNDQPLLADLQNLLQIPVAMANDANCFALAETRLGIVSETTPNAKVVFGVIMGTGVGGGLVVNGEVLSGVNGIGGEWGHNFLHESGGQCYCGKTGCVETVISGPALEQYYTAASGQYKPLKDIAADQKLDPLAKSTIDRLLKYFGIGVSGIINMIDPDVIVIGGGVGNIDLLYSKGIEEIKKHVFNPECNTQILKPKLGDSAGVFGAAFLN